MPKSGSSSVGGASRAPACAEHQRPLVESRVIHCRSVGFVIEHQQLIWVPPDTARGEQPDSPGGNQGCEGRRFSCEDRRFLNPHQVAAALFAFRSPLSKGALLADEVGLGKTIEAGLVLSAWTSRVNWRKAHRGRYCFQCDGLSDDIVGWALPDAASAGDAATREGDRPDAAGKARPTGAAGAETAGKARPTEGRTLLVLCGAFRGKPDRYPNLTVKKIPKTVLSRCEWGHDDYSLRVENLPKAPPKKGQISMFAEEAK